MQMTTDISTDYDLFLHRILDEPEEHTNWLVFADWLEEYGDSRAPAVREADTAANVLEALYPTPDLFASSGIDLSTVADKTQLFTGRILQTQARVFPVARRVLRVRAQPGYTIDLRKFDVLLSANEMCVVSIFNESGTKLREVAINGRTNFCDSPSSPSGSSLLWSRVFDFWASAGSGEVRIVAEVGQRLEG